MFFIFLLLLQHKLSEQYLSLHLIPAFCFKYFLAIELTLHETLGRTGEFRWNLFGLKEHFAGRSKYRCKPQTSEGYRNIFIQTLTQQGFH